MRLAAAGFHVFGNTLSRFGHEILRQIGYLRPRLHEAVAGQ